MARLNREENLEVKYLRKVLSTVDERIQTPDSLRGDRLRQLIENIEPAPEPVTAATLLRPRRWFTWQSGLTYAAAFVLIVGLFYGLGFNNAPSVLELESAEEGGLTGSAELAFDDGLPEADVNGRIMTFDAPMDDADTLDQADSVVDSPAVGGPATGGGGMDAGGAADMMPFQEPAAAYIGGQSESIQLGHMNDSVLVYRTNDPNDPDKAGGSISLEVLAVADDRLISQIDLSLDSIHTYAVYGDTLALVGGEADGVSVYALDMSDMAEPHVAMVYRQQGDFVQGRLYGSMLHVASYTDDVAGLDCAVEELPDRENNGACVLRAIDLNDYGASIKAFVGADSPSDIRLHNVNVFVTYDAVDDPGSVAQIILNGLDMEIGSVA